MFLVPPKNTNFKQSSMKFVAIDMYSKLTTPSSSSSSSLSKAMSSPLKPLLHFHLPHHQHNHLSFLSTKSLPKNEQQITNPNLPPLSPQEQSQLSSLYTLLTTPTPSPSFPSPSLSLHFPSLLTSPSLLPSLLLRLRFSHSSPLPPLHLFLHLLSLSPSFSPPPPSLDTLLFILSRSRLFRHAHHLLALISQRNPSLITPRSLNVLLARVSKTCSVRQTVETFFKCKRYIKPFDTSCFNALLRSLAQERTMADARNVYHALKHQFRPDTQTFNILLSGWRSVEDAEQFFDEMVEIGVRPDLVTYNCLVDVYCKGKEIEKAYKVMDKMRDVEIYPDVITYTSLIGGMGLIGQPDKAKEVLKEMREAGCYPDVAAYNAAIRNYCIAKRLGNAFALLDEIGSRGMKPNPTSYNLFFRCFYWTNDLESSWRLYRRMVGEECLPNTQTCMFLIRLCRRHEKVGMAVELWGDMVEKGFGSLTLVSDVLIDLLCDMGRLEEAERCFKEMVEKGQKPSMVSFRRIRVLMELAKEEESIAELEEMMARFKNTGRFDQESEDMLARELKSSRGERRGTRYYS